MQWFREAKWGNDRARRAMQRYSNMFSGKQINISMWRHMAIAISNRYLNKAFGEIDAGGGGDDDDDGGEDSLVDSIHDLQAGHGSHIAGLIYARLFGQGDLSTMNRRDGFRKVSMQWHRFFGFGAEDRVEQLGTKRPRYPFDEEREMTRRNRFGRLHRVDMQGQLKQMMGATAAFRGQQESVIRAVARGEWPIVQIAPTGGGKSLTILHTGWGDGSGDAVGSVAGRHGGALFQVGDRGIRMEKSRGDTESGIVGVCDARVSRQQGIQNVCRADARAAKVGPGRGG
ncbi:hypothetical protein FPOAC2_13256 [Fusarium poae]